MHTALDVARSSSQVQRTMLLHAASTDINAAALAACADEPIHIPGTIQSRGILLALDAACETILIASANAATHFDRPIDALLGHSASALFGVEQWLRIRSLMSAARERVIVPIPSVASAPRPASHAILAHRNDDRVIVELIDERDVWETEAVTTDSPPRTAAVDVPGASITPPTDPLAIAAALQRVAAALAAGSDLSTLTACTAREVRQFTGYDRVMVFQFDGSANGTVIAEARRDDLEPFLGLHYPASDIPAQARALYLRTRIRVLESAVRPQVALLADASAAAARPLDLGASLLRSMSPIHLQYLRNMGVEATLVISIVVDGALWGLVACHHMTARWPSFAMRAACEILSEFISMQIAVQRNLVRAHARSHATIAQAALIRQLMTPHEKMASGIEELLAAIPSGGVVLIAEGQLHLAGSTPSVERIVALVAWLTTTAQRAPVAAFDHLALSDAAFADVADVASGLLVLDLGGVQPAYVMWFRPQETQTVRWAGVPTKPSWDDGGVSRLSPRGSFKEWTEIRRGYSAPWLPEELLIAETIRGALVDVVMELLATRHRIAVLEYVRIRSAVDAASDGMAMTDASGHLIYINRSFETLTGYALRDVSDLRALFAAAEPGAHPLIELSGDVDVLANTGERIPIALRVDAIVSEDGASAGSLYMLCDRRPAITLAAERDQHAQRLAQSERLESLGIMAGGIAHDFNNLLTTIAGNATLAHMDLPADSEADESLTAIDLAVEHAAGLCRQLLAYAGKAQLVMLRVDVNALITDLVQLLRPTVNPRHSIDWEAEPDLPAIAGDQTQLRQVIMNLIINATDAIGNAPGRIVISTSTTDANPALLATFQHGATLPSGPYVMIRVSDTGHGMDPDTMHRIFDPFFSTKTTGRGLGLAAALGTVKGHHGALRVASTPGVGTTFTVLLPTLQTSSARAAAIPAHARRIRGGGRTILLVDDDASLRDTVRRILERAAFNVVQADDGSTALALYEAEPTRFTMIVSDVAMHGLGGVGLLQTLRSRGHTVPIVLFSGYSVDDVIALVAADTHSRFVQKPFAIDMLEAAMADLLPVHAAD